MFELYVEHDTDRKFDDLWTLPTYVQTLKPNTVQQENILDFCLSV